MQPIATKLLGNLGPRAYERLGAEHYASLLGTALRSGISIARARDFKPLDLAYGRVGCLPVQYRGKRFLVDLSGTDGIVRDGTYTFGAVRELYIRDCYFRHQPERVYRNIQSALDLGANRGLFSLMMAATGARVVSAEIDVSCIRAIHHNMEVNDFTNYAVERTFMGAGGKMADDSQELPSHTVDSLLDKHGLDRVDFVKMDIEGSEFELFENPKWLERVGALSMEVHSSWGDPARILSALHLAGFTTRITNHVFKPLSDLREAEFIYAWK